jgi:hypothetical protein
MRIERRHREGIKGVASKIPTAKKRPRDLLFAVNTMLI